MNTTTSVSVAPDATASAPAPRTALFAATILLSAFLLFQVQLLMGKFILPWFGGASAVWTTTILFFQVLLLAGYGYAHFLSQRLSPKAQVLLHGALLALCAVALGFAALSWQSPITPGPEWRPDPERDPIAQIVAVLAVSVGLPFFLLSATAPLLQRWFSLANPGRSPYVLYAVSNIGSLAGLLTYPVLVEPQLAVRAQGYLWGAAFVVFAVFCIVTGIGVTRVTAAPPIQQEGAQQESTAATESPSIGRYLLWFALSATGSLMMLATTNLLTLDVASIPLLWVLPLSIYLLTFILCFESSRWYKRAFFHPFFLLVALMTCTTLSRGADAPVLVQVFVFSLALFTACMVCHGELAQLRPAPRHLTAFYFTMSAGGAAGGLLVNLVIPHLFAGFWEFHLGFWFSAALLLAALLYDRSSWIYARRRWLTYVALLPLLLVPAWMAQAGLLKMTTLNKMAYFVFGVLLAVTGGAYLWSVPDVAKRRHGGFRWVQVIAALLLVSLGYILAEDARIPGGNLIARARNFYGVLTVREYYRHDPDLNYIEMTHGRISHGLQLRDPAHRRQPTAYFGPESGAALAILEHPRRFTQGEGLRVGVIGLGVGTLATYGRPQDYFRYYEINPDVIRYSGPQGSHFSFLKDSQATIDVDLGDGRLTLERQAERGDLQKFDVLVVDAFSSDSIPVHLLTREAFELYQKHLRDEDSVIVVQITNRVLNLEPVVAALADDLGLHAMTIANQPRGPILQASDYVLLARSPSFFAHPQIMATARTTEIRSGTRIWTDQYSNLYSVLK